MLRALTFDTDRIFSRPSLGVVPDEYSDFAQYDHIFVNESEYAGNRDEELESLIESSSERVSVQDSRARSPESTLDGDLDSNVRPSITAITEHQLSLLYPTTLAFAISSKQWSRFAIFY